MPLLKLLPALLADRRQCAMNRHKMLEHRKTHLFLGALERFTTLSLSLQKNVKNLR